MSSTNNTNDTSVTAWDVNYLWTVATDSNVKPLTPERAEAIKWFNSWDMSKEPEGAERVKRAVKMLRDGYTESRRFGWIKIETRSDAMTWSRRSMQFDGMWPGYDENGLRIK